MDQGYIEDLTDELAYLVEESGRDLARYDNGSIEEEDLLTTAEKALGKYENLVNEVTKAVDSLEDRNFAEDIKEGLERSGYRNLEELAAGKNPVTASGENSARSAINSSETDLEIGRAFQVIEDFDYLMADIKNRYNIETPYPDFEEEVAEEEMEIMEEASELEQQGIPIKDAVKDLDPL
jgi:hypothetical protein